MYIREDLNAQPCKELNNSVFQESVWCYFSNGLGKKVLLGCIYKSPNSTEINKNELINLIKMDVIQKFDYVCIMGDFNFPNINWESLKYSSADEDFVEAVYDAYLIQMVTRPTRRREGQRPTCDDLIFTNDEEFISDIDYNSPLGKSDHDTLIFQLYINKEPVSVNSQPKFILSKGNYTLLKKSLAEVDWSFVHKEETTVEECWEYIKNAIITAMNNNIPKVDVTTKPNKIKPVWLNNRVLKKIKKKYHAYKRYLQTQDGVDYQSYIKLRNECTRDIRKAKYEYEKNVVFNCKTNSKCFWKYVRDKLDMKCGISSLKKEDGSLATENKDKADVLNNFFSSVFTREDLVNIPYIGRSSRSDGIELTEIILTAEAVKNKLKNLNVNKACGPDGIPARILKEASEELSLPLVVLFNKSINCGTIPQEWKRANVSPIFKKGNKNDPENYRPVSLTSILCKILETFIRDAILAHMISAKLFSNCQHGFRPGRSCMTQLIEVMEDFTSMWDDKESFDTIYLDFRKAFDKVPHKRLTIKLESYGIVGNVLKWIQDFLTDRHQYVKMGSEISEKAEVLSGIPQGSVLGPILFIIFINDLPDSVSSTCKIFADDTKLYNFSKNSVELQDDIDKLVKWSNTWQLFFNVDKCKVLHYGKKNPKFNFTITVDNICASLEKCEEERDLGIIFDNKLNFDKHISQAIAKANKMLGIIKRAFSYLDCDSFLVLFKSFIRPCLEYGNTIWNPIFKRQSSAVEKVQRRATKLLGKIKHLSYGDRLRTLNLPSLKFRRLRGDLIQTYKIINNINDTNADQIFQMLNYNRTRNSSKKIFIKHANTNTRKNCFSIRSAPHWNLLPEFVKNATNLNEFKNLLDQVKYIQDLKFAFD